PRLDAPGACSARRGRAQLDDCLARAAVLTRERAAPGLRRGGRRAGVRRHHRASDRRDRQCGQHDAAGRRRGRRRDPPRRRTHDPGRVPPARRLRHRRRQVDARRAAAGPRRHPRRPAGLPRRPARGREGRRLATRVPAWQRGEGRRVGAAERERTAMRRVLVALVLLGIVLGRPAPLRAHSAAAELGLAVGAAAGNLVYLPVKGIVALGGLVLGGVTGALTGGDVRAAYAIWVPAASGTYLLTPAKLEGTEPI